jgi:hypothetical protein
VRSIKEKNCYVALNPHKEEKDTTGRTEAFRLPDGNTIAVWYQLKSATSGAVNLRCG